MPFIDLREVSLFTGLYLFTASLYISGSFYWMISSPFAFLGCSGYNPGAWILDEASCQLSQRVSENKHLRQVVKMRLLTLAMVLGTTVFCCYWIWKRRWDNEYHTPLFLLYQIVGTLHIILEVKWRGHWHEPRTDAEETSTFLMCWAVGLNVVFLLVEQCCT